MSVVARELEEISEGVARDWSKLQGFVVRELEALGPSRKTNSAPEGSPARRKPRRLRPGYSRQNSAPKGSPPTSAASELTRQDCSFTLEQETAGLPDAGLPYWNPKLQITDLQQENDQMKHEIAALRAQLVAGDSAKLQAQLETLTAEKAHYRTQMETWRSKEEITQKEVESLHTTLHDANREIASLKQKFNASRHNRKVHQRLFKMSCKNIDIMKSEFDSAKRTVDELRKELAERQTKAAEEIEQLKGQLRQQHEAATRNLETGLDRAGKLMEQCQAEAKDQVDHIADTKRALVVSTSTEIERLRDVIRDFEKRPPALQLPIGTPRLNDVNTDRTNRRLQFSSVRPTPSIPLPTTRSLNAIEQLTSLNEEHSLRIAAGEHMLQRTLSV